MEDLPAEAARFYADRLDLLPERFIPMVELVLDEIAKCEPHLPTCHRRALAVRLVVLLHQQYGGSREYWPKPERIARALRDARIWAEHDGTAEGARGTFALARRYHLPPEQIAEILATQCALHQRGPRESAGHSRDTGGTSTATANNKNQSTPTLLAR